MHRSHAAAIVLLFLALLPVAARADEPQVVIVRAVFGSGKGAAECADQVRKAIADRAAITEISTPGLGLKNPKGVLRQRLVIQFTVDGKAGSVAIANGQKVNLYGAIIAASQKPETPDDPAAGNATPPALSNGKGYMLINVKGIIGHHFTDVVFERCLKAAEKEGVNTIVLEIDSPGGLSSELEKITRRLVAWQTTGGRAIAYAKPRALSAGAIIAIACKEIFMSPASTIGATTEVGGPELSGAVKLKRDSASRASDRALAEFAGHDYAIIEAMSDPGPELYMKKKGDEEPPVFIVHRGGKAPTGAKRVKERGKVLTLTAQEAESFGLVVAVVADIALIGGELGIEKWTPASDQAAQISAAAIVAGEESSKELARLSDLIAKALAAPLSGNLQVRVKLVTEHRAAKAAAARIHKIVDASPYFGALVDTNALDNAARELDRRIAALDASIEAERPKN